MHPRVRFSPAVTRGGSTYKVVGSVDTTKNTNNYIFKLCSLVDSIVFGSESPK